MQSEAQRIDSRASLRQRVLKAGKILFNNQAAVINCRIQNISETGAKLVCADQQAVPEEFEFVTVSDNEIRSARVMWRKADLIGIDFTSPPRRAPARNW